jgi:hypothetical protein
MNYTALYFTWEKSSVKSLILSAKNEKGNIVLQVRTIEKDALFLNANGLYYKGDYSTPQH